MLQLFHDRVPYYIGKRPPSWKSYNLNRCPNVVCEKVVSRKFLQNSDINIDDGVLSLTVLKNTCNGILGLEQVRTPLQVFSSEFVKFLEKLRLLKGKRGELILFNSKWNLKVVCKESSCFPSNKFMLKVNNISLEKGVKHVQSWR